MTTVAIIAFDGFTDLDLFLHWDLLNRPKVELPEPLADWQVVLLGTAARHRSRTGLEIEMQGSVEDARCANAVLHSAGPAVRALAEDPDYLRRLDLDPVRQILAAQCSGALVLGALGLLKGLTATTIPGAVDRLESYGARVVPEPFVAHARLATAASCLDQVAKNRNRFIANNLIYLI